MGAILLHAVSGRRFLSRNLFSTLVVEDGSSPVWEEARTRHGAKGTRHGSQARWRWQEVPSVRSTCESGAEQLAIPSPLMLSRARLGCEPRHWMLAWAKRTAGCRADLGELFAWDGPNWTQALRGAKGARDAGITVLWNSTRTPVLTGGQAVARDLGEILAVRY